MMLSHKLIGGAFDPDAQALFRRMTTPPDLARKRLISSTIRALKRKGIWQRVALLYFYAAHTQQAALLNWRADAYNLALVGSGASISFVANDYLEVVQSGNASWLDSTFPAGSSPLYQPVSAHLSAAIKLRRSTTAQEIAMDPNGGGLALNFQGGGVQGSIAGDNFAFADEPLSRVQYLATRNGTTLDTYKAGGLSQTKQVSGTIDNATTVRFLFVGSVSAGGALGRMASVGLGLTAQQAADFSTIVNDYMTAIGAPA